MEKQQVWSLQIAKTEDTQKGGPGGKSERLVEKALNKESVSNPKLRQLVQILGEDGKCPSQLYKSLSMQLRE